MSELELNEQYWNLRWKQQNTGWDVGYASPVIITYFKQNVDKNKRILIPGCGSAYEAEELAKLGFENIFLLDIAEEAINNLKTKFAKTPSVRVIKDDFFNHTGTYDYIIEQTFFCALSPTLRNNYTKKMASLLTSGGRLVGLLFNSEFEKPGPPFGGVACTYVSIFDTLFHINKMEECDTSIPQRLGNELFFEMSKK